MLECHSKEWICIPRWVEPNRGIHFQSQIWVDMFLKRVWIRNIPRGFIAILQYHKELISITMNKRPWKRREVIYVELYIFFMSVVMQFFSQTSIKDINSDQGILWCILLCWSREIFNHPLMRHNNILFHRSPNRETFPGILFPTIHIPCQFNNPTLKSEY